MSRFVRRSISETRANGKVSGKASRIVIGWTKLSNWAARIMYMKRKLRRKATRKFCFDSPMTLALPTNSQR